MPHFDSLQGWLSWQEGLHPHAIDMGLERVNSVYQRLNPGGLHPPAITVAGTNGKGSCVAYLEAVYLAQGYRVGAYTSPHILRYNERIKINGEPVSDTLICQTFARIEAVRGETTLSYFEYGTLAALDIFSRSGLDVQLLEVGLGGRLDAVNIINAEAAVITSIGIDHVDWLGTTRESIGAEKAGIFRAGVPAIVGDPEPPASVIDVAERVKAKLYCLGSSFGYQKHARSWDWFAGDDTLSELPNPALKGEHQFRNAASAIMAIRTLSQRLPVSEQCIRQGLKGVKLSGRFQLITGEIPVLLDVGHNPQAVKTLADYVNEAFPEQRIHAVFSMVRDKDVGGVLDIMGGIVDSWYFAPFNNSRAISEETMRGFFTQKRISNVQWGAKSFVDAYNAASASAKPGDLILVFGSFFLVSDCLAEFNKT
ncbi:MAG: bifunctional tetrahydrofolate synthase/dihydrofolate synthase [Methylomonas sp.]|nr:MAG: bifunctional tetrahydrofolate synthase/dihydrofolate synthase [Methylobacter sp.]PPD36849.1 MAG: bifunctional tetrahydrofolate synthase/dihydrofolate synthase [Methylomonas sp.]